MIFRHNKNWLGETDKGQHERRIRALEAHINDLEIRLDERVAYLMRKYTTLYLYSKATEALEDAGDIEEG